MWSAANMFYPVVLELAAFLEPDDQRDSFYVGFPAKCRIMFDQSERRLWLLTSADSFSRCFARDMRKPRKTLPVDMPMRSPLLR